VAHAGKIDFLEEPDRKIWRMASNQKIKTAAAVKEFYFAQGPWFVIKEYAGIYGDANEYSKFLSLPAEVILDLAEKHGVDCEKLPDIPSFYGGGKLPRPYHHQDYRLDEGIKHLRAPRVRPRHYLDEVSINYHKKNHPEMYNSIKNFEKELRGDHKGSVIFNYGVNLASLTPKELQELEMIGGHEAAQDMYKLHSYLGDYYCWKIFRDAQSAAKKRDFYRALNYAVKSKMKVCVCGTHVSTHNYAFQRHLKSDRHCHKILTQVSMPNLEYWYQASKEVPIGFEREVMPCGTKVRWSHIIPEDPQRNPAKHVIGHKHRHDLCFNIVTKAWGRRRGTRGGSRYNYIRVPRIPDL